MAKTYFCAWRKAKWEKTKKIKKELYLTAIRWVVFALFKTVYKKELKYA